MNDLLVGIFASIIATIIIAVVTKLFKSNHDKNCFIEKITLESTPLFKKDTYTYFDKVNYFCGANASGKTALSEWISTLENDRKISRWLSKVEYLPIIFSIKLKNSSVANVRIIIDERGMNYFTNDSQSIVSPISYNFVFLAQKRIDHDYDAVTYLAENLSISTSLLSKLIEHLGTYPILTIQELKINSNHSNNNVIVKLDRRNEWINYFDLSDSEQQRVLIELGLLLCANYSKSNPVVLIIEQSSFCINIEYYKKLIEILASNVYSFQSFIISVEKPYFNNMNNVKAIVFSNKITEIELVEL